MSNVYGTDVDGDAVEDEGVGVVRPAAADSIEVRLWAAEASVRQLERDLQLERDAHRLTADKLTAARDAILAATLDAVRYNGACYPGARDLLLACGVEIPTETVSYSVTATASFSATVTVDVEVDAILAAQEENGDDSPDVDLDVIVDAIAEDSGVDVDRYSVDVQEVYRA